jgi:hypothetical protein
MTPLMLESVNRSFAQIVEVETMPISVLPPEIGDAILKREGF